MSIQVDVGVSAHVCMYIHTTTPVCYYMDVPVPWVYNSVYTEPGQYSVRLMSLLSPSSLQIEDSNGCL